MTDLLGGKVLKNAFHAVEETPTTYGHNATEKVMTISI